MKKKRLLIIDDDSLFRDSARQYLSGLPVDIHLAGSGKKGLELCQTMKMDIVLLDQKLPDMKGADLYRSILSTSDKVKIIFVTAYPDLKNAVTALKDGVHDYITKPFEPVELFMTLSRIIETLDLEQSAQVQEYTRNMETSEAYLVGQSKAVEELRGLIDRAAQSCSPVFVSGETGTGKNRVAKAIHYNGPFSGKPFLVVNCAAIPENLIEAELFGVEKGAYTGADKTKKGLFELAEGGTLLLDEIGEMPVAVQSKLLGVLDERKFRKVGGGKLIDLDVRVIAATNVDVEKALRDKSFRSDLYYRLSILPIHIPPLRERREDIPLLATHFMNRFAGKSPVTLPSSEAGNLCLYPWPGNIRELSNIIERSVILRQGDSIAPSALIKTADPNPANLPSSAQTAAIEPTHFETLRDMEENHIRRALSRVSGNFTRAARLLGISRSTLMRKLEGYSARPSDHSQD